MAEESVDKKETVEGGEAAAPVTSPKQRHCSELIEEIDRSQMYLAAAAAAASSPAKRGRRHSELCELGLQQQQQQQQDIPPNADDEETPAPKQQLQQQDDHRTASSLIPRRRSSMAPDEGVSDPWNVSYHPKQFSFYKPPKQRQRWGQKQILPRVNWGDLFFDLFYVAMAYNVSNILVETPSGIGALYFMGTFLAIKNVWVIRMSYDARFVNSDDVYHRLLEIAGLTALASAVVHVRNVSTLSHPSQYVDMFIFCLSLLLCQIMMFLRYVELAWVGNGQRDILKSLAVHEGKTCLVGIVLQLAACVVAGVEYFVGHDDDDDDKAGEDGGRLLADTSNATTTNDHYHDDDAYTFHSVNHAPIWCCLMVPVSYWAISAFRVWFLFPSDGSHKAFTVPFNIDFVIHRDGEWTMLMLGESILSLLIVDLPHESSDYFATFYCSLLTVILLQYLHFRSQPHSADDHVMRRSMNRGMVWKLLWHAYSGSLIAIGAAFTLFLLSFSDTDGHHRMLLLPDMVAAEGMRDLAAAASASNYAPQDLEQRAAHLFSAALSLSFFALDGMCVMHVGFVRAKSRCYCHKTSKYNIKGLLLVLCRGGVIVFVATMSQWMVHPETLSEIGLAVTVVQILLRKLGEKNLGADKEQVDATEGNEASSDDEAQGEEEEKGIQLDDQKEQPQEMVIRNATE